MIDLERDIKITPEDIEIQNRLRRERRPLNPEDYLEFLNFMQNFFVNQAPKPSLPKITSSKKFEL
jgi:hypothetical protein